MTPPSVYLAGPIQHAHPPQTAREWRLEAQRLLALGGISALNPLRDFSVQNGRWTTRTPGMGQAFAARDFFDIDRADAVLLCTHATNEVSIGSMIEVGYALHARKPIVWVRTQEELHDNGLLHYAVTATFLTLREATVFLHQYLAQR